MGTVLQMRGGGIVLSIHIPDGHPGANMGPPWDKPQFQTQAGLASQTQPAVVSHKFTLLRGKPCGEPEVQQEVGSSCRVQNVYLEIAPH